MVSKSETIYTKNWGSGTFLIGNTLIIAKPGTVQLEKILLFYTK